MSDKRVNRKPFDVSGVEMRVLGRKARSEEELVLIRAEMSKYTKEGLAAVCGVGEDVVRVWEQRFSQRCKRECSRCGMDKPYDQFAISSVGKVTTCLTCREKGIMTRRLKGRMLQEVEFQLAAVPARASRIRMSPAEGISGWYRPQIVASPASNLGDVI